ncbi:MAG TPA: single-stranded DNA-binding protein [Chthoniobacterales bacterium]|nr:single-stranded DNA-binding protein [Chthoniobacterales bacterium]
MILNDVKVIGNLVNDPEVRFTPKGTPVANLSLGINETYTVDDEKRQITTFVDVQVWGPSAENLGKMVRKGQEILIEGPLRQDRWEDKQTGQNRSKLYVKADRWQFTQYKRQEESPEAALAPAAKEKNKASKKTK